MKDPKRFLTDAEKAELLEACRYQCQGSDCIDRDLHGKAFEFHHIEHHANGGLTTRYQHLVLCIDCHAAIHKIKTPDHQADFGNIWDDLREWQREGLQRFIEMNDKRTFVLEASPGAGKSLFAACASRYVIDHRDDINHVICIAPWVPILSSMKRTFGRLQLDLRDKFHYDKKRGILQQPPMQDVTLDTYSGFCNATTVRVIEHWKKRFGFSFMLILDEVHHTNIVSGTWGPYAEKIASLATKILVMSGTYFRSDNKAISFLEYENDRPTRHYRIDYAKCVSKRYVRQVSFRFHDPKLEIFSREKGESRRWKLSNIPVASSRMMASAKSTVLDSRGPHVEALIADAWRELQVMRGKWSDAACLVVCRGGSDGEEERNIHAVESKIKELTGVSPEVVTSDDSASRGRLEAFNSGSEPFLCAIRMVSEGVDIPRIRMVLFLTFTDSEMLFRQIVGRCIRYIPGKEDDTAALVIMPKFPVMADFADRFENEAKLGALKMEAPAVSTGEATGDRLCSKCFTNPCRCFVVIDSEAEFGGGQIASSDVDESYIARARELRDRFPAHQHANVVQLGDALQKSEVLKANFEPKMTLVDIRTLMLKNIDKKLRELAKYEYNYDYEKAWTVEIGEKYGTNKAEIAGTWRIENVTKLHEELKARLMEVICGS